MVTPDELASLIRFQAAAEQLQTSARAVTERDHTRLDHIGRQLLALIREIGSLVPQDERLAAEFARLFAVPEQAPAIFWRDVEPKASALAGWLRGAIDAGAFQARIDAEAQAYAEARLRAERPLGFGGGAGAPK
jgi:hypothetical protein